MKKRRTSRSRHWLVRCLICLLLGALTTVAVTTWLFYRSPTVVYFKSVANFPGDIQYEPGWEHVTFFAEHAAGYDSVQCVSLTSWFGPSRPKHPVGTMLPPKWVLDESEPSLPNSFRSDKREYGEFLRVAQAGWPLRCFVGRRLRRDANDEFESDWATLINMSLSNPYIPNNRFPHERLLPLKPRILPLLANSVLYGSGWFALSLSPALLPRARRMRRRERGLCPKCAYDLQARFQSGCPECGWNRTAASGDTNNES